MVVLVWIERNDSETTPSLIIKKKKQVPKSQRVKPVQKKVGMKSSSPRRHLDLASFVTWPIQLIQYLEHVLFSWQMFGSCLVVGNC